MSVSPLPSLLDSIPHYMVLAATHLQVPVVGFGLHLPPTEEQQQLLDQWHQQAQEARAQLAKETEKKGMQVRSL